MITDDGPTAPLGASIVKAGVALLAVLALAACQDSGSEDTGDAGAPTSTDLPAASDTSTASQ